jgi:hypothetical protein
MIGVHTNFSSIGNCRRAHLARVSCSQAQQAADPSEMGLTKNLLQLHDSRIGTDTMNRLRLPQIHPLLKHLTVCAIGIVLVSHCFDVKLDKLEVR